MKVLITHPGRQHSHQAAVALEKAGLLAGYWAGVPALEKHGRWLPAALWRRWMRYAPVPIAPERVRWAPWAPGLRRIGDRLLPQDAGSRADYVACRAFDHWAAARMPKAAADAVIATEISALTTFRFARERGMTTFLDAPSIHHRAQDRLHGFSEPADLHRRITAVKDREVALADHILTVSPLASETYIEAGVPPERVHSVLLGADLELFTPQSGEPPAQDGFSFLFAGAMIRRKGFDLLLEAFARVRQAEPGVQLRIAGPRAGDLKHLLPAVPESGVRYLGPLRQADLATELRRTRCLVLPSRNDSYGMVVAEALACGTPALISTMVGSRELVAEGRTGWLVPSDDVQALVDRMLWCARHPSDLTAMQTACREAAEAATWDTYHRRFADLIRRLVPEAAR